MKIMPNKFEQMASQDLPSQDHAGEQTSKRAAELKSKLCFLEDIQPLLTSRYIVKGWIEQGASSVVYGESNVGKTFFALDMAMHIAAGVPWHNMPVQPPIREIGGVVYVAGEGGTGLYNRIAALRVAKPELVEAAQNERGFVLLPTTLDFCGGNDADAIVEALSGIPGTPRFIIIDTLARTMGDGDENTARDMGMFIKSIDRIRYATGAHIMIIHHSGKDASKGARGSGSLRAAVDTEIHLTKSRMTVTAETTKQRDMLTGQRFGYYLQDIELGEDEDGDPVTSAIVEPTELIKEPPRLSERHRDALRALDDALDRHGETSDRVDVGRDQKMVQVKLWREICDDLPLCKGTSNSGPRKAFHDVKHNLEEKGFIQTSGEYVWKVA